MTEDWDAERVGENGVGERECWEGERGTSTRWEGVSGGQEREEQMKKEEHCEIYCSQRWSFFCSSNSTMYHMTTLFVYMSRLKSVRFIVNRQGPCMQCLWFRAMQSDIDSRVWSEYEFLGWGSRGRGRGNTDCPISTWKLGVIKALHEMTPRVYCYVSVF